MKPSSGNAATAIALARQRAEEARVEAAKNAFQDAVHDAFRSGSKPSPQERAILRDLIANASCPRDVADDLRAGDVQLDTTEFLNFFLDSVMPEEKRVNVVSKVTWGDGAAKKESLRPEKQTKLEFSFPSGSGTASLSAMLQGYQSKEILRGEAQYETPTGEKVNAEKNLQLQVSNPEAEIVISLKRFEYEIKPGEPLPVRRKIENPVLLDDIVLPLQDDPDKTKRYRATSFIVHGGGLGGGHYTTYVQENDDKWYCYNDSLKTEVSGARLEAAKNQAYVVKYSPLGDNGRCILPRSQGNNGTANGGNRCWANAAFAFALSMTSLHDNDHIRGAKADAPKAQNSARLAEMSGGPSSFDEDQKEIERCVGVILDLDESSDLKAVLNELGNIKPGIRKSLNERLRDIGGASTSKLLENAALNYLLKLTSNQGDKKTNDILGLLEFFSNEQNKEGVLKIIDAVTENKDDFISDPQGFCAKIINSSDIPHAKKELEPKSTQFLTAADLCYQAILEGNGERLQKFLPHAIKQDKDFLKNALCFAVLSEKPDIANLLISSGADQDKKSLLYGKTAKEIGEEIVSKSKPEAVPEGRGLVDSWKWSYPAKFKTSEAGEYWNKAINNVFDAFDSILPWGKAAKDENGKTIPWPLGFLNKMSLAVVDLALSIVWGVFDYILPAVINAITWPVRSVAEEKLIERGPKSNSREVGNPLLPAASPAAVKIEGGAASPSPSVGHPAGIRVAPPPGRSLTGSRT